MNLHEHIGRIRQVMGITESSSSGDWALKYNNPMALIQSNPSNWLGLKGDDDGRLIFDEMWYGVRAGVKNLKNAYFGRGNNTPIGITKVYAPHGHGSNDPNSYAEFIADLLSVDIDTELNFAEHGEGLSKAIINMETGIPVGVDGGVSISDFKKGYRSSL